MRRIIGMCYDPNALKIYTDGSALKNPGGPGGFGMIVKFPDNFNRDNIKYKEGYFETTNNRMELLGVIRAIEFVAENARVFGVNRTIVITDSFYVYRYHSSAFFWKKNGWLNKDGKPIENHDLWKIFLSAKQKCAVILEIKWEKGKTRDILCEVDELAKTASNQPTKKDYGYTPGKCIATKSGNKKAATLFRANGQSAVIRIYMKSIKGKFEKQVYKISFELFSDVTKVFDSKCCAYLPTKDNVIHRGHYYKVIFNNNPAYPMITQIEPLVEADFVALNITPPSYV